MIRAATEADAEAVFRLLFAARGEIPLTKIETDPKEGWLKRIREWCAYNRSLVTELDGEVVSVMIVGARERSKANLLREIGEAPREWELLHGTTHKDYRSRRRGPYDEVSRKAGCGGLFKALFLKAIEPFETIYARYPDNTSEMAKTLLRWGFTEEARLDDGIIEFKLTRGTGPAPLP